MPVVNGYGYGEFTRLKTGHFKSIVSMHLAICRKIFQKWPGSKYTYLDLTAGPGLRDNEAQSPVVFAQALRQYPVPCQGVLFERDEQTFRSLQDSYDWDEIGIKVCKQCHREGLLQVQQRLFPAPKPYHLGLLYYDPTPCFKDEPSDDWFASMKFLEDLSREVRFQSIDFLFYVSATAIKRVCGAGEKGIPGFERFKGRSLLSVLNGFRKDNWLVRDTFGSREQWTFLLGTNFKGYKPYTKIGLYQAESEKGSAILRRLELSREQLTALPKESLFDDF